MSRAREITVSIPSRSEAREGAIKSLVARLAELPATGFAEIWVSHDPFPSLCGLVDDEQGWLMCLRYNGDAGFSSRNRSYVGGDTESVPFMLANGQIDHYPASWCYPRDRVLEALCYFARHGQVPSWLSWNNDSGDGTESPNEPFDTL